MLIRSNRLFRMQLSGEKTENTNFDFVRKFSQLVEKKFRETRNVSDYAALMGIAADTLTKKLQKLGYKAPSLIIRQRIVTEAKRLLIYTNRSVKEISCETGIDDPHYFSRIFRKETGFTPLQYRHHNRISWNIRICPLFRKNHPLYLNPEILILLITGIVTIWR